MRKLTAMAIVLVLSATLLAACGNGDNNNSDRTDVIVGNASTPAVSNSANSGNNAAVTNNGAANTANVSQEPRENAYTLASAEKALAAKGVNKAYLEPAFDCFINEAENHASGDEKHGVIRFTKNEGYVTDEEGETWQKQIFDLTASISDDGYNIQGYSWGDGLGEKTWDNFLNGGLGIATWSYRYNGVIMDVYAERAQEKPSEYDEENDTWTDYYNAVQVNIATGKQAKD